MSCPEREQLAALARAATPGPWQHLELFLYAHNHRPPFEPYDEILFGEWLDAAKSLCGGEFDSSADVAFVAAANPAAVLALLGEIEQLERRVLSEQTLEVAADTRFSDEFLGNVVRAELANRTSEAASAAVVKT